MITINFTDDEIRALVCLVWKNPCTTGCVYKYLEEYKGNCSNCPLTKAIISIKNKLGLK